METYNDIKKSLLAINRDLGHVIETALSTDGMSGTTLKTWGSAIDRIERQLAEETVRVAIVGSIKSGKSTLTNSLFGMDYVKRGAGVVTSIVTKVKPGRQVTARLDFKTWDEVNAEMAQALVLFSAGETETVYEGFDINKEKDRARLQKDLSNLKIDQLVSDDARDPNSVLLIEYLKGYDQVKGFVSFEPQTKVFEKEEFDRQKDFVGTECLAVYLRDVCLTLEVPKGFGENLEIADCQGSDSPNPLHLAMIQDYLIQTHLIIYVLSSRTGVRQADIRFLTLIKKMGLTKNVLFVVNCDFSEHQDLADLQRVVGRVEEEIGMILPSRRIFVFSALFNLFKEMASDNGASEVLSRKDFLRLEQWRQETDMVSFSDRQTDEFLTEVIRKLSTDRFTLLLEANLERMANIASGLQEWLTIGRQLLEREAGGVQDAFTEMDRRRKASDQVTVVVKDTLNGTTAKLKQEVGIDVDRFFDIRYGEIGRQIIEFIDKHNLSAADYEKDLQASGFLHTLYRIFQALQQATNGFIAESINPKLVEFVGTLEDKVEEVFGQVAGPYSLMIEDAVKQHKSTLEKLKLHVPERAFKPIRPPGVAIVKNDAQLRIPRLASTMQYSARIKTEAVLRLGFYNTVKTAKKLFKKPVEGPASAIRSLQDSVRRIKEEMQTSIADHFIDYKENLKHQYVFRLVDTMSAALYETLHNHMMAFTGDLSDMRHLIKSEQSAKEHLVEQFSSMDKSLGAVSQRIEELEESARRQYPDHGLEAHI
jgi:GTPase SAR1 family protein